MFSRGWLPRGGISFQSFFSGSACNGTDQWIASLRCAHQGSFFFYFFFARRHGRTPLLGASLEPGDKGMLWLFRSSQPSPTDHQRPRLPPVHAWVIGSIGSIGTRAGAWRARPAGVGCVQEVIDDDDQNCLRAGWWCEGDDNVAREPPGEA